MAGDTPETLGAGAEPVTLVFDRRTCPDPADRARAWQAATSVSMETGFESGDLMDLVASVDVLPVGPFLLADVVLSAGTLSGRARRASTGSTTTSSST